MSREFSIRWKGFRGFTDTGWVTFKPLTLILGPNNSGKTSLFAPLLALKQTIESKDPGVTLKARGEYINLGGFEEYIIDHNVNNKISLSLKWPPLNDRQNVAPGGSVFDFAPLYLEIDISYDKEMHKPVLNKYSIFNNKHELMLSHSRLSKSQKYRLNGASLPNANSPEGRIARMAVKGQVPRNFLFHANRIIQLVVNRLVEGEKKEVRGGQLQPIAIPSDIVNYSVAIDATQNEVRKLLASITYIGPLRSRPRRLYELSDDTQPSVGVGGENTPDILLKNKGRQFNKQLNKWIRHFDFGVDVICEQTAENVFSITIRGNNRVRKRTNIADTGFGLSQVLPLLVSGLTSPKEATLIFEQPEIHLNPRLQCRLADFFADILNEQKNLIVETHSEHLLLSVRKLIAQRKIKASNVCILFVQRSEGRSLIEKIPIDDNGHIKPEKWPKGFFEDALSEATDLAVAQLRNAK